MELTEETIESITKSIALDFLGVNIKKLKFTLREEPWREGLPTDKLFLDDLSGAWVPLSEIFRVGKNIHTDKIPSLTITIEETRSDPEVIFTYSGAVKVKTNITYDDDYDYADDNGDEISDNDVAADDIYEIKDNSLIIGDTLVNEDLLPYGGRDVLITINYYN